MKIKSLLTIAAMALAAMSSSAAVPDGYYNNAENKTQQGLLTALYNIIHSHTKISYDGLWDAYTSTDTGSDGYYIDMYSTAKYTSSNQCGNYSSVGDCVNREHSFPKSWWGSNKDEKYSDIFHLYPTDGYVNNQRSNYPFGVCANGTRVPDANGAHALGKKGTSTYEGYSGIVFEPDDIYKGDFARTYFYMATCYNNQIANWNSDMLAGNNYPVFTTWAINMLLEWNRLDPVSEKEINRNDSAYKLQGNRNPYIDHPELAEYIWGNQMGNNWTSTAGSTPNPVLISPSQGTIIDFGALAINSSKQLTIEIKGNDLSEDLSLSTTNSDFTLSTNTITAADANAGTTITITYNAPATAQLSAGTLGISSSEVSENVSMTAQAVDGIPAQAATEISTSSFQANWTNVGFGTNYTLTVMDANNSVVSGYPVTVTASHETYLVTGLNANTKYYYQLSCGDITSNVIEVTTLEPATILSIQTSGDFMLSCIRGEESPVLTAQVYTEYVEEDIELTISGNFEISLDKLNWTQQLNVDKDGETFYIRFQSTDMTGTFDGILTASTATLSGATQEIEGIIYNDEMVTAMEDWEGCATGGYWTKEVQGSLFKWYFSNAGIWGDAGDKFNGQQSCRFGKNNNSAIYMTEDFEDGASQFTFKAAPFGTDASAVITVSYSVDGGTTWTEIQDFTITSAKAGALNEYSTPTLNILGDVRFKIQQSSGSRVNIDDIEITSADTSTAISILADETGQLNWDAVAVTGGIVINSEKAQNFEIYNLDAKLMNKCHVGSATFVTMPAGIYIVVNGNHSKKIIVK
ncbi:MAG: endonuclease [Muribaculaceae bacterium]|nr:endonuclease [Muribaculaceae bacterium]